MNSVELYTQIDELAGMKKEIVNKTSNLISKYIISTVNSTDKNFNSYIGTVNTALKDFNDEEKIEILKTVVINLANNGNFSNNTIKEAENKKKRGSSDFGGFLRS